MALITIISYPNNEINTTEDIPDSLDSNELIKSVTIDMEDTSTDEYVEITYNGEVVTLLITEECRYTPVDIYYQNKEGQQATLTFFKSLTESLSITSEEYESDRGQPNNNNHQFIDFNINGRTTYVLNSGFVSEELNEDFKQLFLSERVYGSVPNIGSIPLNISSKNLEFKTRQKDRLINYEVTFKAAYNEVNNI